MAIPNLNFEIHFTKDWFILLVPVVLMGLDILCGFMNAWRTHEIKSSKLRDGIMHKFGELLVIVISLFLQYSIGMPKEITSFMTLYIIVMELISIAENLGKLGVKLPKWLTDRLKDVVEGEDNGNERN